MQQTLSDVELPESTNIISLASACTNIAYIPRPPSSLSATFSLFSAIIVIFICFFSANPKLLIQIIYSLVIYKLLIKCLLTLLDVFVLPPSVRLDFPPVMTIIYYHHPYFAVL